MDEHLPPIGAVIRVGDEAYRIMAYPEGKWVSARVVDPGTSGLEVGQYTQVPKTVCVDFWERFSNHGTW